MSPLNNSYNQHDEPDLWNLGVRGRKTGIQLPMVTERDQYNMEPVEAYFSSPDRVVLAASRNGDHGSDKGKDNGRAEVGEEMDNEPGQLFFRELGASMLHFDEPSPLQLQPLLPVQIDSTISYPLSTPEQNNAQTDFGRYDKEPHANAEAFSPTMSGSEDSEDIECQDSQHEDTSADTLRHLKKISTSHSRTSSQQSEAVEPELPTSPRTIHDHYEETMSTSPQEIAPTRGGKLYNTALSPPKGTEGEPNSQKRPSETLSLARPEISCDEFRPEEADCARKRKRPRKTAAPVPNGSSQANPVLTQRPQPKGRPARKPKKGIKFGGKCTRQRKVKTVVRPEGHTYTTRSGRVCNTPVHDWRGDTVAKEYESVPDATGRGHILLPTVTQVVRAPTKEALPKGEQRGGGCRKSARKRSRSITNTERETWEDLGTLRVNCKAWQADQEPADSEANGEVYTNRQVAFTSEEIMSRYPAKRNLHFGKIATPTSMSFGILHLPSGQRKAAVNTRGFELVFFLHSGKVCVELEQQSFRVSEGSSWNVPRGNLYSIINDYRKDARMFFCMNSEM